LACGIVLNSVQRIFSCLFLALFLVAGQSACSDTSPSSTVRTFLDFLIHRKFTQAYSCLSRSLQDEFSFARFKEEALQARQVQLFSSKLLEKNTNFARLKLKGKILWEENNRLVWVLYEGKADLLKEDGCWRILAVDFEPVARSISEKGKNLRMHKP